MLSYGKLPPGVYIALSQPVLLISFIGISDLHVILFSPQLGPHLILPHNPHLNPPANNLLLISHLLSVLIIKTHLNPHLNPHFSLRLTSYLTSPSSYLPTKLLNFNVNSSRGPNSRKAKRKTTLPVQKRLDLFNRPNTPWLRNSLAWNGLLP